MQKIDNLKFNLRRLCSDSRKKVGPPYCQAEMYAGRVVCCPPRTDRQTDRPTDARPLHCAFSYRRGQRIVGQRRLVQVTKSFLLKKFFVS